MEYTSSVRVALISRVDSNIPSCDITLAGCPILVTFNRFVLSGTDRVKRRSRMLSTDKFDAPHTSTRFGSGFASLFIVSWRMISMRVCVFPVPYSA